VQKGSWVDGKTSRRAAPTVRGPATPCAFGCSAPGANTCLCRGRAAAAAGDGITTSSAGGASSRQAGGVTTSANMLAGAGEPGTTPFSLARDAALALSAACPTSRCSVVGTTPPLGGGRPLWGRGCSTRRGHAKPPCPRDQLERVRAGAGPKLSPPWRQQKTVWPIAKTPRSGGYLVRLPDSGACAWSPRGERKGWRKCGKAEEAGGGS